MVVSNGASATISMLVGDGSGALGPALPIAVGGAALDVKVADLNRSGIDDVVIHTAAYSRSLVAALGDGSMGYSLHPVATFFALADVEVAESTGDGVVDIVASVIALGS